MTWRSTTPMDRLVVGDVGFGKTEIAIRAAFKAVQSGKQVAILVPTTLLASQHFQTFSDRFAPYPIRVEMLSRFLTPAEARRIATEVRDGQVDVLIGTHRLLSEDVSFPRLGLLIVDEEQRFGVKHKETDQDAQHRDRRADPFRHTDPTDARDEPHRNPGPIRSSTPLQPIVSRSSPTSVSSTNGRSPRRSAESCSVRARSSSSTTASRASNTPPRRSANSSRRPGWRSPTDKWTKPASRRS